MHNNNQQNTLSIRQVHYPNTKPSITIAYNQITPPKPIKIPPPEAMSQDFGCCGYCCWGSGLGFDPYIPEGLATEGRSGSTEPLNGGISKDFSRYFTPNRFQTGRLSRFGVKCRLFGGERGWRAHQRQPTPTNASQGQPTSDTKSIHSKTGRAIKIRSNLAVGVLPLAYVCPGNGELLAVVWP
ncbi:hypothetical protein FRC0077_02272 [Corynebacterium diphtheriae]|nr:hypothetical protein FRC0076_02262 [Corynebacterium diphtheriae]CAB0716246.1 hypothetical protein FRC0077_02272 [Corynebacterium diphtheriae]